MKKSLLFITLILAISWAALANASSEHRGPDAAPKSQTEEMEHDKAGTIFTYDALVEGVRAEFQVMSLASMNKEGPQGNTHHVMVKFFNGSSEDPIKSGMGKIKVINPSGKEQIDKLVNYSGIFAANFTFDEKGRYGVICLFKVNGKKRLVKFWYPHG